MKVAIIDHGLCNMDSIARAVERCGGDPMVLAHPQGLETAHRIVVPGVGAFGKAMQKIEQLRSIDVSLLVHRLFVQVPFFGCQSIDFTLKLN